MLKIKNTKLAKAFVLSSTLAVPAVIGLGATLFLIHSNESVNNSTVFGNFLEGENLFKLYAPYIDAPQNEKDKVFQAYNQAKDSWTSKKMNLEAKLVALDQAQASAFDFYIQNLDKVQAQDEEPSVFWNKILANQEGRIRELDLKNQLTQLKKDQSIKFLEDLYSATSKQKQEYLKNVSQEISKLVVLQNQILAPFIKLLEGTSAQLDSLPFEGLKKDVSSSLTPLYSRIISDNIRLNEVQIASQDTTKEVSKLQEVLQNSQSEINEIQQYLKLIKPYENNAAYSQAEKENVKKFISSTQINLNIALSKADINQIHNSVVTFYQQISDTQKTVAEIKQVISELNTYVDKFDSSLRFNKEMVSQLITQVLALSNKKELISAKANLFSEFYALKFANEIISDLKTKVNNAKTNNIVTPTKATHVKSQIDTIINKNLPAKSLANELFNYYKNQVKELEDLTYLNNELKLLETQINEVNNLSFTSEGIKTKLLELHNQVTKTYSNSVTVSFLNSVKNTLNETLRTLLKEDLKILIELMDQKIKTVNNLHDLVNSAVIDEAEKLNEESLPMTKDFNPIPSANLVKQIKIYDIKLQNLVNANKQTQAENDSNFTFNYLKVVFSDNNDNYLPTDKEQKRIDLYNEYKSKLDQMRSEINSGSGNAKLEEDIETISKKLKNLSDTGNDFRKLSLLDKQAQTTLLEKQKGLNSLVLKPYIDSVEKARAALEPLFNNPDATPDQIIDAQKALQKALKELNEADTKILLEQKIAQLKNEIAANYQNDLSSPGAQALLKNYNDLLQEAKDVSNQQNSNASIAKADDLISITPYLFEAEINKKRLLAIIGEKTSAPFTGDKTNTSIKRANEEIKNIDDLIKRLNNPSNIPNLEAFENAKLQLLQRGDEILLAYEQEKVEKLNQLIQATKNTTAGGANENYARSLVKVNNYATVQKSQLNFQKATEAANKMELLLNLANVSGELLNSYNLYNQAPTQALADYISNLLLNNELLSSDSNEQIVAKIQTLNKAKEIIVAKKEFLDVYQQLKDVLDQNKDWKIYAPLKNEINLIFQESNAIIFNNDLTIEQIQAKKAEFVTKIKLYKDKKANLFNLFNQAITSVDAKQVALQADADALITSNPSYDFNTYFAPAKEAYARDKTDAQKVNVDTDDINAYLTKLEIAYQKDLALNKLKDVSTTANSANFGTSDLHIKAKNSSNSFDSSIKNNLNLAILSLEDVMDINRKIERFSDLFTLQKRVADYIAKDPTRANSQTLSIEQLKNAVDASLPIASDGFSEINTKYEELNKVYLKEVEIQEIRENIVATLENDDLSNGQLGIVKSLENALGATYDSEVNTKLNNFVSTTKTSATTSTSRDDLIALLNKVNEVKNEVPAIASLAKNVANAKNTLDALTNNNSNLINSYSQKINNFITEAKSSYFRETPSGSANNIDFYNDLSNKIHFSTLKLSASDQLAGKLQEIRDILSNNNFNLRSVDGQLGLTKLNEINTYLNNFETAAQNDEYSQESVQKINNLTQKANLYKNITSANLDVLIDANNLANNNVLTSANDLKSLLLLVWDSVPRANAYNNSTLGRSQGNPYNVNDLFDLTSANAKNVDQYSQLSDKIIQEIGDLKAHILTKNTYRVATHNKIETLKNQTFTPLVHNDLKNELTNFLNTLDNLNNTQNTLTTAPDQSGELNAIRAKVNIVEEKINLLKELATKAYDLNVFNNKIISNEPLLRDAKTQAQALIDKAKTYFGDSSKMSLSGSESIENLALELEAQKFRLTLLTNYEEIKNEYDSELSLPTLAKNVIKTKLDAFLNEYNSNQITPQDLFNKYFRKASDVPAGEPASIKNSLIKYALENAINLQKEFTRAQSFIALQDSNLDNNAVTSKFTEITNLINNAQSGAEATLNKVDNDETFKLQLISAIKDNINALITAKKDQLQEQLTADNEIKTFFDSTKNNFAVNQVAPTYVDNFEQKAITDLNNAIQTKDNLSYSEVNVYLANAKSVASLQIFDLYTKATNTVENIQTSVLDYFNDFAASKTTVRAGSEITNTEYAPILTLKNTIETALNVDFNSIENYSSKINALVGIINGNYQSVIDTFVNTIKEKFAQKFAPAPQAGQAGQAGFYVKLIQKLDELKQNVAGQNVNLFKYNEIEGLENEYDAFKNKFDTLNTIYTALATKNDSGSIASFATSLEEFNHTFVQLEDSIKLAVSNALLKNPLKDVFADIFETIRYDDSSSDTDAIKNAFNTFKQGIETILNSVDTSVSFSTLNKTNNLDETLKTLLNKITEYKDWIKQPANKQLLLNQLNNNPNKTNPLLPLDTALDGNFDHKYKVVIAKDEITRKKFTQTFNGFTSHATGNNNDLVQIDNNDAFLAMFEQFAYTKKDVKDQNDLKSIYSPIKFKVYIKKYDQNGWFNLVAPTENEVDRQSLKAKIVYSYESNSTDIGELQVEKEVVMTFKTLDTVAVTSGTSSIFTNAQNQVGINAKVEVIDVDEAGWNIPQVANAQDANYQTIKTQVITKVYNKMKAAIFDLNANNSTNVSTNLNTNVITPNDAYLTSFKTTTDPNLANLNYTSTTKTVNRQQVTNNRLTAVLDNDNRDTTTKYGFDFDNQTSIPITYNISLTTSKDNERLIIFPDDNEKGFSFLQLQGGIVTGFPSKGRKESSLVTPERYDNDLRSSDTGKSNIWNDGRNWFATPNDRLPTGVNFNLYSFNFDYDPVLRKVYLYNSWTENGLYTIKKGNFKTNLQTLRNNTNLKVADANFVRELVAKFPSNVANYTPTPSELSRVYQIYSTIDENIFNKNGRFKNTLWLNISSNGAFGGLPLFPISGGQSIVNRTAVADPTSAKLAQVENQNFKLDTASGKIAKDSARDILYSAIINKFFFKIR
ncbi:Uncharacterised protein [Mycoplasmopsis citelli]|uniref:Uncharacterized protein n=1 Tax=Mycoplasmopsis citelli TaxID=171281 RepID=A0A449B141_9BACT|nr:hypothetical protein [Mycoplasmopsis citelli]VEU74264.1 Uncharacterised protein [Mycoplasmopsis citelli]